ncbi:MAG: enoyl-CoA hydratase/isomerase family protein [Gammaproteobacteria bacterium]
MSTNTIEVGRDAGTATLTLNRPDRFNALDDAMARDLNRLTAELAADESVRCVVIRGAGGNFQAGGDIEYFRAGLEHPVEEREGEIRSIIGEVHAAITNIRGMPKPVIAAVEGAAAGFGISLLAACDLAIAADNARFTLAYCLIGTSPDGGSTYALPRMVGSKRAMELALLGERFDAARAESMGLVNRVVPVDALDGAVAKLAAHLAEGPTLAYAQAKALINNSWNNDLSAQLDDEMERFARCALSDDFAEGVRAFCEKRPARFVGR